MFLQNIEPRNPKSSRSAKKRKNIRLISQSIIENTKQSFSYGPASWNIQKRQRVRKKRETYTSYHTIQNNKPHEQAISYVTSNRKVKNIDYLIKIQNSMKVSQMLMNLNIKIHQLGNVLFQMKDLLNQLSKIKVLFKIFMKLPGQLVLIKHKLNQDCLKILLMAHYMINFEHPAEDSSRKRCEALFLKYYI